MKNLKIILAIVISTFLISPMLTKATSIINANGIEISESEYNNFIKVYTHESIMAMTESKYNEIKAWDYNNVQTETKYLESVYNPHLMLTTEHELTEEEYEEYEYRITPYLDSDSNNYSSTAKRIVIALMGGETWNHVVVTATWKVIPITRSFDVTGIRGFGFSFREGSQEGQQIYISNGEYKVIDYAWNGTNIKKLDNGFGISMNIVNDKITDLQTLVECDVKPTENYPAIYGSYQHAVADVTLAQSQNYTLGGSGLGGVFVWPYSVSSKYDGMSGVSIQY